MLNRTGGLHRIERGMGLISFAHQHRSIEIDDLFLTLVDSIRRQKQLQQHLVIDQRE